jgi:hypothetical protein
MTTLTPHEIMPGALRLRLAHGYATRRSADAARLDATCPRLHYYRIAGRVTELRGTTDDGHLLRVHLTADTGPAAVIFTLGQGQGARQLHVPLAGASARKVLQT